MKKKTLKERAKSWVAKNIGYSGEDEVAEFVKAYEAGFKAGKAEARKELKCDNRVDSSIDSRILLR